MVLGFYEGSPADRSGIFVATLGLVHLYLWYCGRILRWIDLRQVIPIAEGAAGGIILCVCSGGGHRDVADAIPATTNCWLVCGRHHHGVNWHYIADVWNGSARFRR